MHHLKAGLVFDSDLNEKKNIWKVVQQKSVAFLQPFQYNHWDSCILETSITVFFIFVEILAWGILLSEQF